jgi:hypothetical protein
MRAWLATHAQDPLAPQLTQTLLTFEAHLGTRQGGTIVAEDLTRAVRDAQRAGALPGNDAAIAAGAFGMAFGAAVREYVPPADYDRLLRELSEHAVEFYLGVQGGTLIGALKQFVDDVTSLAELVAEVPLPGLTPIPLGGGATSPTTLGDLWDLARLGTQGYVADRQRKAEQRSLLIQGLWHVVQQIVSDPSFMTQAGADLGRVAGEHFGGYFHGDFMQLSSLQRGEVVGEIAGRITLEVALLFLGPEEWIARGASAAAQAARATRVGARIFEALRASEVLRPLLRLGSEAAELERLGEAARVGKNVVEHAGDVGKVGSVVERTEEMTQAGRLVSDVVDETGAGTRAAEDVLSHAKPETPPMPQRAAHAGPEGVEWSTPSRAPQEHGTVRAGTSGREPPRAGSGRGRGGAEPPKPRSAKEAMAEEAREEMRQLGSAERPEVRSDIERKADEVRTQINPRLSESSTPSERLRAALEKEGIPVPEGHEAHHMVAESGGGKAGQEARDILEKSGIPMDSAANGVPLPRSGEPLIGPAAADTAHMGLHTDTYYEEVARRLRNAFNEGGEAAVQGELVKIRRALMRDEFPH